ncbi:MAG: T9SS type A sorting domain-containing protein [Bacteroidota bacterium]
MFTKYIFAAVLFCFHFGHSQTTANWSYTFGDSSVAMEIFDFFADTDGTFYAAGQKHQDGKRIFYVAAISEQRQPKFERTIEGIFEEKGLLVSPVDEFHIAATGYFEDSTGTFNFRTVKLTKTGEIVWNKEFGKDGKFIIDVPTILKADPRGNIIAAGSSSGLEQYYSIAQYSPDGNENWSLRHQPLEQGQFRLIDLIVDQQGNMYGITSNTFTGDTSHGTIFKRDSGGTLLWEKHFDIYYPDEMEEQLVLCNDTLYAAGMLLTEGSAGSTFVCIALTSSGAVAAYKRFTLPENHVQQSVRALASVSGDSLVLVNESSVDGKIMLHTYLLDRNFSILFSDSLTDSTPLSARVFSTNNGFGVYTFGSSLHRKEYRRNNGTFVTFNDQEFSIFTSAYAKIFFTENYLYTSSIDFSSFNDLSTIRQFTIQQPNTVITQRPAPSEFTLYPPFPNPFNPATTISYLLPAAGDVVITVYDLGGRIVKTIVHEFQTEGFHSMSAELSGFSSGTYFLRATFHHQHTTQKIVLVR